jgi:hypothetical protein
MPDDAAKNSKVQTFIDKARILVEQAKQMVDNQLNEAREKGKAKWYRMCYVFLRERVFLLTSRQITSQLLAPSFSSSI